MYTYTYIHTYIYIYIYTHHNAGAIYVEKGASTNPLHWIVLCIGNVLCWMRPRYVCMTYVRLHTYGWYATLYICVRCGYMHVKYHMCAYMYMHCNCAFTHIHHTHRHEFVYTNGFALQIANNWVSVRIYSRIYIYIHTYIHTHLHIHYTHICIYMHAYIHTYIHTCIHAYIHIYIHTCTVT